MPSPGESYYEILNVREDATPEEITTSYRKLAKVLHPDVCPSPEAENLFKVVNEAYQVLRDPKKREDYDVSLLAAAESSFGEYYKGKRYRDPRTWYYTHTYHSSKRPDSETRESAYTRKRSSIPRIMQVVLFYASVLMASFILVQLFLIPWMSGVSASEARTAFDDGNRWMHEAEYQKAIESYTLAVDKLPGFMEGWRAKGLAELKKAEQLGDIGLHNQAESYYQSSIRSLQTAYPAFTDDIQILTGLAKSYSATGADETALGFWRKAHELSPGDTILAEKMGEAEKFFVTSAL